MLLIYRIRKINTSLQNLRRALYLLDMLVKFGFDDLLIHMPWPTLHRYLLHRHMTSPNGTRPERVRMLMEALGPTFVKLGQILATRSDIIPLEYALELTKLQDKAPTFPFEKAKEIIEQELGKPIEKCFRRIEETPMAAASMAQAHRAIGLNGEKLLIKVQRPGIGEKIRLDVEVLAMLAKYAEEHDNTMKNMNLVGVVEEFRHVILRELDFGIENAQASRFAREMGQQPGLVPMKIYDDLSTSRILVMDEVQGLPASKLVRDASLQKKYDCSSIAHNGANAILSQIFDYGFFHADPHPGNIFILPDSRITFIDFGMMGKISNDEKMIFIRAIAAMLDHDYATMLRHLLGLVIQRGDPPNMVQLERDISDLVDDNLYLPLEKMQFGVILEKLMQLLNDYNFSLRSNLFIMFKAVMTIESLGRALDPNLELVELLKPFVRRLTIRSYNPLYNKRRILESLSDMTTAACETPPIVRDLLKRAEKGELTIRVEHHRLDAIRESISKSSNGISTALILSSIIIGASLVVLAKTPPLYYGVPVVGVFGYLLAALIAMSLLLKRLIDYDLRHKK